MKLLRPVQSPYRVTQWRWQNPSYYKTLWYNWHMWIDYAHITSGTKQTVHSANEWEVVYASWADWWGNVIIIKHNNGYETLYAHLSEILVSVGQIVYAWDEIWITGDTGNSKWIHLHFWLRPTKTNPLYNYNNGYRSFIDPTPYIVDTLVDSYDREYQSAKKYLVDNNIYNWEWEIDERRLVIILSRILKKSTE